MYKFVTIEEYEKYYKDVHPNARVSPDGSEVVMSCNLHGGDCTCITHSEALTYIEKNWETSS